MEAIQYAIALESQICRMIEIACAQPGQKKDPITDILTNHQSKMLDMLKAMHTKSANFDTPIEISVMFDEHKWSQAVADMSNETSDIPSIVSRLCFLWMLQTYYDKTYQFYRQASQNTPLLNAKYFYSSLAEIKSVIRRRIDASVRVLSNEVWGQVGFAPFMIGKD